MELGNRITEVSTDQYDALAGVTMEMGETWEVEVSTGYRRSFRNDLGVTGFVRADDLKERLSKGFNPFKVPRQMGDLSNLMEAPGERGDLLKREVSNNIRNWIFNTLIVVHGMELFPSKKRKRKVRRSLYKGAYPSNLTISQWNKIKKLIPPAKTGGRPRKYLMRKIFNAIFYILKTGCPWRYLPKNFPPWQTVYFYFRAWVKNGLWEKMNRALRKQVRKAFDKKVSPSVGIIDSQSVKTTSVGGKELGYDGGKKIKGRKRHILVDTLGLIICIVVHSAGLQDRDGAILLLDKMANIFSRIKLIWADGAYGGTLIEIAKGCFNRKFDIVRRTDDNKGFKVLRKRWIVERTFGWLSNYRRNSKDYERLPETSEAMVYMSIIHLMVRRLAK